MMMLCVSFCKILVIGISFLVLFAIGHCWAAIQRFYIASFIELVSQKVLHKAEIWFFNINIIGLGLRYVRTTCDVCIFKEINF